MRLLLLEDDPNLSKTLIKYLTFHNYHVDWAKNGEEAIELSFQNRYALYLFDINVPLLNGIDLLSQLRDAEDFTPTIIISAMVDIETMTKGFIAGADDYVKKPFDPEELLLRIKAKTAQLNERLLFNHFELDLNQNSIYYKKELLDLSRLHYELLSLLIKTAPNPVSYDVLLELLDTPSSLALRVNISRIKKEFKLPITSVRGVGYKVT